MVGGGVGGRGGGGGGVLWGGGGDFCPFLFFFFLFLSGTSAKRAFAHPTGTSHTASLRIAFTSSTEVEFMQRLSR